MVATWRDDDSQEKSSQGLDDLINDLCLMANEDEVNTELDFISNEKWELAYLALYDKYKKMKSENKALKKKIENIVHDTSNDDQVHALIVENQNLKIEVESMKSKLEAHDNVELQIAKLKKDNDILLDQYSTC